MAQVVEEETQTGPLPRTMPVSVVSVVAVVVVVDGNNSNNSNSRDQDRLCLVVVGMLHFDRQQQQHLQHIVVAYKEQNLAFEQIVWLDSSLWHDGFETKSESIFQACLVDVPTVP